jgi:hypothetical protein
VLTRSPAQHQAPEFARTSEIDDEPLLASGGCRIAAPRGGRLAIERKLRFASASRRGGRDLRRRPRDRRRRQLLQRDIADVHGASATTRAGGDGEFDRRRVVQRAVLRRAPREVDLPFFDRDLLPFAREREARPVVPPHVVATFVDQLDLQVVDRCVAAQPERDGVILGQVERQRPPRNRIARGAAEIEVQPQRRALRIAGVGKRRGDAIGCNGLPRSDVVEAIEHAQRRLRRRNAGHQRHERDGQRAAQESGAVRGCSHGARFHPLTLPIINPWM